MHVRLVARMHLWLLISVTAMDLAVRTTDLENDVLTCETERVVSHSGTAVASTDFTDMAGAVRS